MTELEHSICLALKREAKPALVKGWFNTVKENAPSGVVTTVTVDAKPVSMIKRASDGSVQYCVPLTRSLNDVEVEKIIHAFCKKCVDSFDFEVFSSSSPLEFDVSGKIEIDMDPMVTLCTVWAKRKHDQWMKEKIDAGWRYGPTVSFSNKTHPLLRQWSELPDQYKEVDETQPQELIKMLNEMGYVLIKKEELDKVMALLDGRG